MKTRSGTLNVGNKVNASKVGSPWMFFNSNQGFAMAQVGQAQYPVATGDGDKTWKTNGPYLHLDDYRRALPDATPVPEGA